MKDLKSLFRSSVSGRAVEELILAKGALEQKSEQLEEKDTMIRKLVERNRKLERELEQSQARQKELERRLQGVEKEAYTAGSGAVVKDVVDVLSSYERIAVEQNSTESILVRKVLNVLQKRHGLEIIDGYEGGVDPNKHQITEVVEGEDEEIHQICRGYRLGSRVIRPVSLRVIKGHKKEGGAEAKDHQGKQNTRPDLEVISGGRSDSGPESAA
ncbi:MAG: nucleotide exchange factor GrpE [Spirochaetota bacterium]